MISIHRFTYNGYSSEDFDLCCQLSFDGDSGEVSTFLSRDAVASETYRGEIQRVSSYKYTDVLAPTITLIDKNFGDFDLDRQRKILRWLTSKYAPSFITIYHDDSNVVSYEILGAFTELSTYKLGSGRVVGFQCVFTSISPFAYSALQTITKNVSNPMDNTITIDVDSDNEESAIYPRITIQQYGSAVVNVNHKMITDNKWVVDDWMDGTVYYYADEGEYYYNKHNEDGSVVPTAQTANPQLTTTSVIIKNKYVDNDGITQVVTMKIANNTSGEKVILDGANRVISSSSASRIFGDDFIGWSWLPLYNGENKIEVIGNCAVTFEYREVRKIGEF
jgi:hypothetical protein